VWSTSINPSHSNEVDSYVKRNNPTKIRSTINIWGRRGLSSLNITANNRINTRAVDFDIVYSDTVIYTRLQLDKPMSNELKIATGTIIFM
jgi:hypothetical protein